MQRQKGKRACLDTYTHNVMDENKMTFIGMTDERNVAIIWKKMTDHDLQCNCSGDRFSLSMHPHLKLSSTWGVFISWIVLQLVCIGQIQLFAFV